MTTAREQEHLCSTFSSCGRNLSLVVLMDLMNYIEIKKEESKLLDTGADPRTTQDTNGRFVRADID